jgi:tRNA-specific 2-thiouridylase
MTRIVAAMSGGVDSSVAAALLARDAAADGHEVVGVWMRTHPDRGEGWEPRRGCCSSEAADDARRAANRIGIPFFVLNVEAEFGVQVIDAFADAYLEGTTPNPCQACNQYIKFDLLARRAVGAYGAEAVATGHYARVEHRDGAWRLLRAADRAKDQTYFLWNLDQRQLAATRFPLGEMTKPEVRRLAADLDLPTAATPESQEICFVPAGDYRALLEERRAYAGVAGPIVDGEGQQVGTHSGYAHYTVGQRRGLGIAAASPRYVREIRPERNEVVVGTRDDLAVTAFEADARHFIAGDPPADRFEGQVRIRHRSEDVACEVTVIGTDRLVVETAEPVWAPAPGQSAVLYRGEECLGGGRIIRA